MVRTRPFGSRNRSVDVAGAECARGTPYSRHLGRLLPGALGILSALRRLLKDHLGLGLGSRVLVLITEGATDPALFAAVVENPTNEHPGTKPREP